MLIQHVPTLFGRQRAAGPAATPAPRWMRAAWRTVAMVAETLLIAAGLMIVGHLLGDWFGVKNPASPGTPGGPTPNDIEAFVAIGAVIGGLVLTGWRVTHGSLAIFAGALVFAIALPDLVIMAAIFAGIGAINFGGWLVERWREYQHERRDDDVPPHPAVHHLPRPWRAKG